MDSKKLKLALFGISGAIVGFGYYYFIGCNDGHCMISSNPYISTSYGSVLGVLFAWDTKKRKKKEDVNTP